MYWNLSIERIAHKLTIKKLQELANSAIQQIVDKPYDMELAGNIIYIGFAHHRKMAAIAWREMTKPASH